MIMERVKLEFEVLKFKVTLFTTILGSGIYLYINKVNFLHDVNKSLLYSTIIIIVLYGFFGFLSNLIKINKLNKEIKENEYL